MLSAALLVARSSQIRFSGLLLKTDQLSQRPKAIPI